MIGELIFTTECVDPKAIMSVALYFCPNDELQCAQNVSCCVQIAVINIINLCEALQPISIRERKIRHLYASINGIIRTQFSLLKSFKLTTIRDSFALHILLCFTPFKCIAIILGVAKTQNGIFYSKSLPQRIRIYVEIRAGVLRQKFIQRTSYPC